MYTTIPTIPDSDIIEYQQVIDYTKILANNTTTTAVLITGLPANYVVCGCTAVVLTSFAGSGLTSLTMSVGAFVPNSIFTHLTYYLPTVELTQFVTPLSYITSGPPNNNQTLSTSSYTTFYSSPVSTFYNGPHDVASYFIASGSAILLTAGAVEVTVQIRPL